MKQRMHSETGRSLLETLSILVVMAILLVASIVGYRAVLHYWKKQETVKQVAELAVRYRLRPVTAGQDEDKRVEIKPIYPEAERADTYTIRTADDGRVSLVVENEPTSFMIKVDQVWDDSCEGILNSEGYDAVLVDKNLADVLEVNVVANTEGLLVGSQTLKSLDKETKAKIIKAICEGENGRIRGASLVFGNKCPKMGTSYWYGGYCHKCAQNQKEDKKGVCCSTLNDCGYCQGPGFSYCVQNPVNCPTNLVCDGGDNGTQSCLECVKPTDCSCQEGKEDYTCSKGHCCPDGMEWQGGRCVCKTGGERCGSMCCGDKQSCVVNADDETLMACCNNDGSEGSMCGEDSSCCDSGNCSNGYCCPEDTEYLSGECCPEGRVYTDGGVKKCCGVNDCILDDKCIKSGDVVGTCGICDNGTIKENPDSSTVCETCNTTTWMLMPKEERKTVPCGENCCTTGNTCVSSESGECCLPGRVYIDKGVEKCCSEDLVEGVCPDGCVNGCIFKSECISSGDVVGTCGICKNGTIEEKTEACQECDTTKWEAVWTGVPCGENCCTTGNTCVERGDEKTCCKNDGLEGSICTTSSCCKSGNCTEGHCCPENTKYVTEVEVCCPKGRVYTDEGVEKCCTEDLDKDKHCPGSCDGCIWADSCFAFGANIKDCGKCENDGTIKENPDSLTACKKCNTTEWTLMPKEEGKTVECGENCCTTGDICVERGDEKTCCKNDGSEGSICTTSSCCKSGNCTEGHCCPSEKPHWNGEQCTCPEGQIWDPLTNECRCPSEKPYWDGTKCTCPEGTFWNDKTQTCTECLSDYGSGLEGECSLEKPICSENWNCILQECPPEKPYKKGTECVECLSNYGSGKEGPCPTIDKPKCSNGTCTSCTQGWSKSKQSCVCCDAGYWDNGLQECLPCSLKNALWCWKDANGKENAGGCVSGYEACEHSGGYQYCEKKGKCGNWGGCSDFACTDGVVIPSSCPSGTTWNSSKKECRCSNNRVLTSTGCCPQDRVYTAKDGSKKCCSDALENGKCYYVSPVCTRTLASGTILDDEGDKVTCGPYGEPGEEGFIEYCFCKEIKLSGLLSGTYKFTDKMQIKMTTTSEKGTSSFTRYGGKDCGDPKGKISTKGRATVTIELIEEDPNRNKKTEVCYSIRYKKEL